MAIRAQREAKRRARQALALQRLKARLSASRRREREAQELLARARAATRGPFIIADLETTGLSSSDEIIDIAAICVNEFWQVIGEFSTLVRIRGQVPKRITELTGITNNMLTRKGVSLCVALEEFFAFCRDHPVFFHNASYDSRMLEVACEQTSMMFTNQVFCSLKISRAVWPQLRSHRLDVLARHIGAPTPTHQSLDDAHTLRHVLRAALSEGSLSQAA